MKIHDILEQVVPGLGYELVDVEITPAKMIRVFIDKDNGVTVDDCELVSQHISKLFFVEEIDYNRLEISSPGLERPLKKMNDFIRFAGKVVKVKTRDLIDGQKVFQGVMSVVDNNSIKVIVDNKQEVLINFENINRAKLIFEYKKNTKPKKGK